MLDNLRRQIRAEAEATLDKALARARREAVQALRRAVLSLIGIVLALFAIGYGSYALFVFLRGEFGALWAAGSVAGLLLALAAICIGFAAILGRKPQEADEDGDDAESAAASETDASAPAAPVAQAAATASPPPVATQARERGAAEDEARGTLQAVMGAVSDEVENDTARLILREGSRQVGGLSTVQLGLLAAVTGFLYAQNAPRRRR